MFDLISGGPRHPFHGRTIAPQLLSVSVHSGMLAAVILEAVVATDGRVATVKVLRSVKFLDAAAIDAVKQWRYKPLVLNGVATPFVLTVTLTFSIK